jgi:chemotaxis signal transduction protein
LILEYVLIKAVYYIDEYSIEARIIVVDLHDITFGLLVDKVNGIVRVFKDLIETPPDMIASVESNQLAGIVKLDRGNRLIMLLNLENVISLDEIKRIQSSEEVKKSKIERGVFKSFDLEESLISFKLGKEEFAININRVQEIIRFQEITRLPNAIHFMEGVINLRGEVIPVFNLRKRFDLKDSVQKNKQKMIIIHISDKKAGLIVDSVSEVLHIEKKNIESLPEAVKSSVSMEFMSGIVRLREGKRILILLNLEMILSEEEKKHFLDLERRNPPANSSSFAFKSDTESAEELIKQTIRKEESYGNENIKEEREPESDKFELQTFHENIEKIKADSKNLKTPKKDDISGEMENDYPDAGKSEKESEKVIKKKSSMKRAR